MVSIEGENMRPVTWCVNDEVASGDWGITGNPPADRFRNGTSPGPHAPASRSVGVPWTSRIGSSRGTERPNVARPHGAHRDLHARSNVEEARRRRAYFDRPGTSNGPTKAIQRPARAPPRPRP